MSSKKIYPVCVNSFKKWLNYNDYNKIYNNLGAPKPFDITLKTYLKKYNLNSNIFYYKQLELYHKICLKYRPTSIEIYHNVTDITDNLLPKYIEEHQDNLQIELLELNGILNKKTNHFIFIPNKQYLNKIMYFLDNKKLNNISFETTISEGLYNHKTLKSLINLDQELCEMMYMLDENINIKKFPFVKLYVSCINECPINGKINNDFIINRLLQLNKMKIDNICLSDTRGTLNLPDFEYIVDNCNENGLPFKKMSLQLNIKKNRIKETEKIIHSALDRRIINFDVADSEIITNNRNSTNQNNLSYEFYYKSLVKYIEKYIKNKV